METHAKLKNDDALLLFCAMDIAYLIFVQFDYESYSSTKIGHKIVPSNCKVLSHFCHENCLLLAQQPF